MKKNLELNLISRKLSLDEIISDHIIDSLTGYDFLKSFPSITDLGSGSGLPGIIIGIIFPDKKITLIEKSPKKCIFLDEAVRHLNLNNISINNALVEEIKIESTAAACRAFKEINDIIGLTRSFFKNKGTYILYKGKPDRINEEIEAAKKNYKMDYTINRIDINKEKERNIVIIKEKM